MRQLIIAIVFVLGAAPAFAESIPVKVTEVAGGVAYLAPGRAAGIVPGTKIRVRGRTFSVFEVTEKTCAVRADRITAGDVGSAVVDRTGAIRVEQLAKPRPPETFTGQWPDPVVPARVQNPTTVALGSGKAPGRAHMTVLAYGYGGASSSRVDAEAEGRIIASYDVWQQRPLALDLDVAGRAFTRGYNRASRTPVFVRAAQLRYGDARDPRLALGRLRYAASSVGMLDGVRASARVGTFEAAAFGGLVPEPLSGRPDTAASRFGGELAYDDTTAGWQPRVAVTAYGSTWSGSLDERRLTLDASAGRDAVRFDAWAEAQQFPAGNPWGARAIELTGAGTSTQLRKHGRYIALDMTFLRPERSLRLDAALPADWLCTREPQPGDVDESCASGDYWATATGSTGMRTRRWAVDAIGSVGRSHGVYRGFETSGYVRGELALATVRLLGGTSGGRASFGSWVAGEAGVGFVPSSGIDVAWRYRAQLFDYVASTGPVLLHSIVADGRVSVLPELD
ncbi:MAG TPA: hypothetical protein VIV11_19620, partial [Kofleriaceae bacterium]